MELTPRFTQALNFTAERHAGQTRRGTEIPYLSHLLAVAGLVLEHGGSEDEAIGALLHDAVEDQKASINEIRNRFGEVVAAIVAGCSDTDEYPKPPWRPRKEAYLTSLPSASASVRLVTAADKLHNARALLRDYKEIGNELWERFKGGKHGTLWYYREIVESLRDGGPTALVEELDRVVSELERLAAAGTVPEGESDEP
jgi:(p)ppGpp synthase/HD superfamily hydrolase